MKLGTFGVAAGMLAGLATWTAPAGAQPLWDRVHVNLPYTVTVGDKTLEPGEYTFQQNQDPSGASRVLLIYSDKGMKFETSALTIPTLDPDTARDTKVVLHQIGSDYYLDKIWVQGKDYGYEFPLPRNVKSREKEMSSVTVPAQSMPGVSRTEAAATPDNTQSAAATPPAAVQPPTTATETQSSADTQSTTPSNPPDTTPPPATSTPSDENNSANRSTDDTTSMPATSAGWLMMLLGGGSLSGLGLALRRKR
ncbi:MAG TPA: hypothetical protein VKU19_41910 [Bryobacteraceae bacterium]|nr:hypothetical protein [Bryobacteraceae bacterium]